MSRSQQNAVQGVQRAGSDIERHAGSTSTTAKTLANAKMLE